MSRLNSKGMSGHQSHNMITDTWLTPPHIIESLGSFDLDPCTPIEMPWETARKRYTEIEDGLSQDWKGRVWLNPPYGSKATSWLNKLATHGNGIALIFARTETEMFFNEVWKKADGVLFIKGRLYFHKPDGKRAAANAGAPSCLIAYGPDNAYTLSTCNIPGKYLNIN